MHIAHYAVQPISIAIRTPIREFVSICWSPNIHRPFLWNQPQRRDLGWGQIVRKGGGLPVGGWVSTILPRIDSRRLAAHANKVNVRWPKAGSQSRSGWDECDWFRRCTWRKTVEIRQNLYTKCHRNNFNYSSWCSNCASWAGNFW